MYYDVYVLGCLMQGPCHGYEIKKKLMDGFGFCAHVSNNSLYPLLKRYLRDGITEQTIEHTDGKPDRMIYTITEKGRRYFVSALRDIPVNRLVDRQLFLMRMYYFKFLDYATRRRLLDLRKKSVQQGLAALENKPSDDIIFDEPGNLAIDRHTRGMLLLDLETIAHFEARIGEPCIVSEDGTLLDVRPSKPNVILLSSLSEDESNGPK